MFQALAFVPPHRVIDAFDGFLASVEDETDYVLGDLLCYFEVTWIGVVQRGRRCRPLFVNSPWNVHHRVEHELPIQWHHSFDLRVAITHPTIRRLVAKFLKEQAHNELLLKQVSARIPLPPPKKKYQVVKQRLK